jgi:hypothetical protein
MAGFTSVVGRRFAAMREAGQPDENGWIWLAGGSVDDDREDG